MADVEAMFYQVKVPDEDSDLLQFLWWTSSSPSCASFAVRKCAEDSRDESNVQAVDTVLHNVDGCLKSLVTVQKRNLELILFSWWASGCSGVVEGLTIRLSLSCQTEQDFSSLVDRHFLELTSSVSLSSLLEGKESLVSEEVEYSYGWEEWIQT